MSGHRTEIEPSMHIDGVQESARPDAMAVSEAPPLEAGRSETIAPLLGSRYRVISQLRQGGFGYTFLAEDTHRPGHPRCVVKKLAQWFSTDNLEYARQLFATEAQTLEELGKHAQIPRLLAYFDQDGEFYLVQELIEGTLLSDELVECWPYWQDDQIVEFLNEMLPLLTFVHQHSVIHRDIKPDNLIRRHQDGKLVLIDFGVAKQGTARGTTADVVGTTGYAPPEQRQGNPCLNSDIYALGMVAIEAATGCHPDRLPRDSHGELKWRSFASKISPWLADILDGMIRQNSQERYPTAEAILPDILKSLSQMPTSHHHQTLLDCISKYDCLIM